MPKLSKTQYEDVEKILQHGLRIFVANAPGTGKTPTTIVSLSTAYKHRTPALVIAPASVTRNWERELHRWAPGLRTVLLESSTDIPNFGVGDVAIISWQLLDPRLSALGKVNWKCLIADEAHFAKNPDANRSMALQALCKPDMGLMLLTGTPIVNNTDEMSQLESLYGGQKPPMIRRLLSEVAPEIPQKKRSYVYIKLKPQYQREYDAAQLDFESWLRDRKTNLEGEGFSETEIERKLAAEALVKIGYLRRILGEGKVFAAADFAARAVRMGEPLVIFCEHQATVHGIIKALRGQRVRCALVDGSLTSKARQRAIDDFQNFNVPVIICTKAGKEGITLHAARHLLFVERFYTSADEDQAEDRIRRIGQKFKTTIWLLHVPNTVDDRVDTIVRNKRSLIEQSIGGETIAETEIDNVEAMLKSWAQRSNIPEGSALTDLGAGPALPPLPSPKDTYAVVFTSERWTPSGASLWCRMNGYNVERAEVIPAGLKMRVHPAEVFKPKQFKTFRVAQDIRVIEGVRLNKAAEKEVRRRLRA
jgi:SNF2 family DNA or RNA helicase